MTGWLSIAFLVEKGRADRLSDWLIEVAGAVSVTTEDADAGTDAETPQFDEPKTLKSLWENNRITALFSSDIDVERLSSRLRDDFGFVERLSVETVEPDDWVARTQSQFAPIPISDRLWIVPSWHEAPDKEAIVIRLDPGMAFGTGSHPTTRLCLAWLDSHVESGVRLLDYGCGSGILAIAAAKLGAGEIVGVDIDPQAVESARQNAAGNGVEIRFTLPDNKSNGFETSFDVVVANILTNPLKVLAPLLTSYLSPTGVLVLSGILAEQAEAVIKAYRPAVTLQVDGELDGWVRLVGRRTPSA